jgi:hypothetical protein
MSRTSTSPAAGDGGARQEFSEPSKPAQNSLLSSAAQLATATASVGLLIVGGLGLSREQWAEQSIIDGSDWQSLGRAALDVLIAAGVVELGPSTFEIACERADRQRGRRRR